MTSGNKKEPIKLGKLSFDLVKRISGSTQANNDLKSNGLDEVLKNHPDIEEYKLNDGMETKVVKPYDLKTLSLSLKEIKKLSDEDLLRLLSGEGHDGHILGRTIQLISNEILSRQIKESSKPHWSAYAVLLLTFIAAVTGVVAILK